MKKRSKDVQTKRRVRQRRQLQWQRDVRMTICMLDWIHKKVKRSCTDCLGRETEQKKNFFLVHQFPEVVSISYPEVVSAACR